MKNQKIMTVMITIAILVVAVFFIIDSDFTLNQEDQPSAEEGNTDYEITKVVLECDAGKKIEAELHDAGETISSYAKVSYNEIEDYQAAKVEAENGFRYVGEDSFEFKLNQDAEEIYLRERSGEITHENCEVISSEKVESEEEDEVDNENQASEKYFNCQDGFVEAVFYTNADDPHVELNLSDEEEVEVYLTEDKDNTYQSEDGSIRFEDQGEEIILEKNGASFYTDCSVRTEEDNEDEEDGGDEGDEE